MTDFSEKSNANLKEKTIEILNRISRLEKARVKASQSVRRARLISESWDQIAQIVEIITRRDGKVK